MKKAAVPIGVFELLPRSLRTGTIRKGREAKRQRFIAAD